MGCTASTSILTVTYESNTKSSKQKFSDYATARTWISSQFPELKQQAFRLQTFQTPPLMIKNTQDYISLYKRNSGELHLQAVLEKPKRYRPEIFQKLSNSIFKVRKGKEDIEATGFLLSPRLCLIGINKNIKEYHALFEDGISLEFKSDGIFVPIGEFSLAELEITPQFVCNTVNNKVITLDSTFDYSQAVLLYYSKTRPIIQEYIGKCEIVKNNVKFEAKPLSLATPGSPVFSENGKVFAIYTANGNATVITEIVNALEFEVENLNISYQEAVEEALTLSNIPINKACFEKNQWENTSVFIDSESNSLVVTQKNQTKIISDINAKEGSSVALTPFGVFITGSDDQGNKNKSWTFNGNVIINNPNMIKKHTSHSSIYYLGKVFVVSGNYTSLVESFDFSNKTWSEVCCLKARRSFTSLAINSDRLYLFGGVKPKNIVSRAVWRFESGEFTKINAKIPLALTAPAVVSIEKTQFIVFGGINNEEEYNKKCWKVNLDNNEVDELDEIDIEMVFGSYPITKSEKELIIYSNSGEKLSYKKNHQKIVLG